MNSVLFINSEDSRIIRGIENLDVFNGFARKLAATGAEKAKNAGEYEDFDIFVFNIVDSDSAAVELAEYFARNTDSGIILVCQDCGDFLRNRLEDAGIFVIESFTPNSNSAEERFFKRTVKFFVAEKKRFSRTRMEKLELENSIEEERLINRAKFILIQYLNMTESQAHHFIEKQSMNLRQTRVQTAEGILKTYEG